MSRLEHYAGQDEIGLRYNSHRTKREEYLVMSGDEFMVSTPRLLAVFRHF